MKFVAAIAAAVLTGAAHAGIYVESVRIDRNTGTVSSTDKTYLQNGRGRMESSSGAGASTARPIHITLFKDDGVYLLDTAQRSYRVLDRAAMEKVSNTMSDAMAKMKAQMAAMPPERRAMMEQMMAKMNAQGGAAAGAKPVAYDAVDTGKTESSNGRSCRVWNVTRNGELDEQYCVAPKGSLPGADEFAAFARKMSAFMEQLRGPMHAATSGVMQQHIAVLEKINGFPIVTRHFSAGKLSAEETVVKTWETRAVSGAEFDIPAGYTRVDFMSHGRGPADR